MKKIKERIKRIWLMYMWYVILFATAGIVLALSQIYNSSIKASFSVTNYTSQTHQSNSSVRYNYFLDFSPSMKGFFNAEVNSTMHTMVDIFQDLNKENEENQFFRCMDIIDTVQDAEAFYQCIRSQDALEEYYIRAASNIQPTIDSDAEEFNEEDNTATNVAEQIIGTIDLTKIFTDNYANRSDASFDSLNIIISDMNFLANEEDWEGHNEQLKNIAEYLGQEAINSNISIYAINSYFAGTPNDEAIYSNGSDIISTMFYLIIFSDNDSAYNKYCQQLESNLTKWGITYEGKFELLNRLHNSAEGLQVDLNTYKGLGLIDNENVNLANGLFKHLKNNEFAIQLVSAGERAILNMPVSTINIPGYYNMTPDGYDDTKLDISVETYYPQNRLFMLDDIYEQYDDTSLVLNDSASMYYNDEEGYIRINLDLNTSPTVPRSSSWYQRILNSAKRSYLVLNVKIYMAEPSFSKPDWVDNIITPQRYDSQMLHIDTVIDEMIQRKEKSYILMSEDERYLGNIVIYVLY